MESEVDFKRFGLWVIRRSSIDAVGPDEEDPSQTVMVLRSGFKLTLTSDQARELLKEIEPDWRE